MVSCHRVKLYSFVFGFMDESKVREIVVQKNPELLSQSKDFVSASVSDLKRSSESNAAEQMSEIKRLKRDAPPSFKRKSNEEQYKANKPILEAVEDWGAAFEYKELTKLRKLWVEVYLCSKSIRHCMD